ncbi:hypothetical protein NPIL_217291, partial [Nephila pilipes]
MHVCQPEARGLLEDKCMKGSISACSETKGKENWKVNCEKRRDYNTRS